MEKKRNIGFPKSTEERARYLRVCDVIRIERARPLPAFIGAPDTFLNSVCSDKDSWLIATSINAMPVLISTQSETPSPLLE